MSAERVIIRRSGSDVPERRPRPGRHRGAGDASGPVRPSVAHPWWWSGDLDPAPLERPPAGTPLLVRRGGSLALECGPGTTVAALHALDPAALCTDDTVVIDLHGLRSDPALARAVAALRVRLLVRGLRVEMRGVPAEVRDLVDGALDERYLVLDGPGPAP